jgi:uncharacterized RmlC-like cupin family protein
MSGTPLVHVRGDSLSSDTAQSEGMRRVAAVSHHTARSSGIWMGLTYVDPGCSSAPHDHGHSETSIYVVSGTPAFSFRDDAGEVVTLHTRSGGFVYVPPDTPHIESNPGDEVAVVVIARTTEEAIVNNLDAL